MILDRFAAKGRAITKSAIEANRQSMSTIGSIDMKAVYRELGQYYSNDAYDVIYGASSQRYLQFRGIYNPTKRVCDWYAHRIYPGPWTPDGLPLPDGTPAAVPFSSDTAEEVRLAAMAGLEWGNFDARRPYYVRTGAIYGDVLIKPYLDVAAGKVYLTFIEPEYVTDIAFNPRGDVISYKIEIPQRDNDTQKTRYLYGEEVTKEKFTTLRDGHPYSYDGVPAEQPNPFGFCPGVWVRHSYVGGTHGAPAIDAVIRKIDELNRIATAANDFIEKLAKQPIGVASDKPWKSATNTDGIHFVNASPADTLGRASTGTFKGPSDMKVFPLIQDIGLGPAHPYLQDLLAEIEKDLPETIMDQQLREMSQVAGIAIPRLMGDVTYRYSAAQRSYDEGLVTALQMLISMGAFALHTGLWGSNLNEAQKTFAPFNLDSYDRGLLGISLMPRPLVPLTPDERAETAILRETIKTPTGLREAGYSDVEIYGPNPPTPEERDGILAEREDLAATTGDALGAALATGRP